MPGKDEKYTKLSFAHDAAPGAAAIISVNTSIHGTKTSPERCIELADTAIKRGAKLLLSPFQIKDYPCLIVEDVFDAFCKVATEIRRQFKVKAISITGSIGKTTTTQMVAAVMQSKFNTHKNDSSANNARLASYVIQGLKPEHEMYVQETMEGPPLGAAAVISKMVQPQAAVITVVGTSHLESFGSQENILKSCLGVQEGMPEDGLLIMNGDDPFQWNAETRLKAVYYAIDNEKADYTAKNIRIQGKQLTFDVVYEGKLVPAKINCFGRHNILNALAAFAAGKWAGMTDAEIVNGLNSFRTDGIRQNYVQYGGYNLFLDCYNAAPESMSSAFDTLRMLPVSPSGRRVAVLADILESGKNENEFHLDVGKMVAQSCVDMLICYGRRSRFIASAALAESRIPVYHTESKADLVDYLKKNITTKDVVLVKGSHGMELEHVIDLAFGTWFHEIYEEYEFKAKNYSDKNFKYKIYTDHAKAIEKISNITEVQLPAFVDGKPLTAIGRSLFNGSKYTHSVNLPETLVNIQYCAFYKANHITEVTIPSSVRIIDSSAFSTCENLKTVVIEPGCMHLGYRAFGNCKNLESITIPETVKQIGSEAFINCDKLTIYGARNSYAEQYAAACKINFADISRAGL